MYFINVHVVVIEVLKSNVMRFQGLNITVSHNTVLSFYGDRSIDCDRHRLLQTLPELSSFRSLSLLGDFILFSLYLKFQTKLFLLWICSEIFCNSLYNTKPGSTAATENNFIIFTTFIISS